MSTHNYVLGQAPYRWRSCSGSLSCPPAMQVQWDRFELQVLH